MSNNRNSSSQCGQSHSTNSKHTPSSATQPPHTSPTHPSRKSTTLQPPHVLGSILAKMPAPPTSPKSLHHQPSLHPSTPPHSSPSSLSDKELYSKCQEYGGNAKKWLQKFAGLLPEVYRRFLYKKHGCGSIHEFAKKLSGMHERTTDKILNLHKRLLDKPNLLTLFESGEQGWSKLQSVAFIATPETEEDFAEKVKTLPRQALEIYVKHQREKLTPGGQAQNNSEISQGAETSSPTDPNFTAPPSPYPETFTTFSFSLSTRSRQKLNIVKLTLEKQRRQTLTWNQVIALWPIHNQKIIIKKVCPSCALKLAKPAGPAHIQAKNSPAPNSATHKSLPFASPSGDSRPIPLPIKNLILSTHGQTCAFPNCNQAFTELHHTKPFALYKSHDPTHIFPICSTHHTLFHAGLIENSEKSPTHWAIRTRAKQTNIDKKAMQFKMKRKS